MIVLYDNLNQNSRYPSLRKHEAKEFLRHLEMVTLDIYI